MGDQEKQKAGAFISFITHDINKQTLFFLQVPGIDLSTQSTHVAGLRKKNIALTNSYGELREVIHNKHDLKKSTFVLVFISFLIETF